MCCEMLDYFEVAKLYMPKPVSNRASDQQKSTPQFAVGSEYCSAVSVWEQLCIILGEFQKSAEQKSN